MRIPKIRTQAKFQAFCTTFAFSYSNLLCSLGAMPAESDAHLHIWYRQWLINLKIHLSCPRYVFGFLAIQAVLSSSFLQFSSLFGCPFSTCHQNEGTTIILSALRVRLPCSLSIIIYIGANIVLSPGSRKKVYTADRRLASGLCYEN